MVIAVAFLFVSNGLLGGWGLLNFLGTEHLVWDLMFLASGVLFLLVGYQLIKSAEHTTRTVVLRDAHAV